MKPILFNDEMVRAILDGRKTQTRRVVTPQPERLFDGTWRHPACGNKPQRDAYLGETIKWKFPFGRFGDRLWVRESWGVVESRFAPRGCTIRYRADDATGEVAGESGLKYAGKDMSFRWRPSIHMPRWASRITLEITDVRVQRLQDISEEDALAEGIRRRAYQDINCDWWGDDEASLAGGFGALWDSIAKPGAKWDDDPWVWAISFQRVGV